MLSWERWAAGVDGAGGDGGPARPLSMLPVALRWTTEATAGERGGGATEREEGYHSHLHGALPTGFVRKRMGRKNNSRR